MCTRDLHVCVVKSDSYLDLEYMPQNIHFAERPSDKVTSKMCAYDISTRAISTTPETRSLPKNCCLNRRIYAHTTFPGGPEYQKHTPRHISYSRLVAAHLVFYV